MMPLNFAPRGEERTIAKVTAEDKVKRHLEDMGILAGQHITLVSDSMGNSVVKVKESKVVLNNELAEKIYVN